jgi:hypothetical protein
MRHTTLVIMGLVTVLACKSDPLDSAREGITYPEGALEPIGRLDVSQPPSGYESANAWLTIAALRSAGGNGTVEVDYIRLYAVANGQTHVLIADEYEAGTGCGADFARYPWGAQESAGGQFPTNGRGSLQLTLVSTQCGLFILGVVATRA